MGMTSTASCTTERRPFQRTGLARRWKARMAGQFTTHGESLASIGVTFTGLIYFIIVRMSVQINWLTCFKSLCFKTNRILFYELLNFLYFYGIFLYFLSLKSKCVTFLKSIFKSTLLYFINFHLRSVRRKSFRLVKTEFRWDSSNHKFIKVVKSYEDWNLCSYPNWVYKLLHICNN